MSDYSIYSKASKCLDEIKYGDFPKLEDNNDVNNIPYSKGPLISNPIIHYLRENELYDSYASGDIDDFGFLTETFFGIPAGRFIKILTIDSNKFKITWVVEDVDKLLAAMLTESNYDWRVFDKFGFTSKSKIIEFKFDLSDVIDESQDSLTVASGIIDYSEFKKKFEQKLNII